LALSAQSQKFNEDARSMGVTKVVYKDYQQLEKFGDDLMALIDKLTNLGINS